MKKIIASFFRTNSKQTELSIDFFLFGVKFNFARKNNLAGIAIWTLGYDKSYPDLWDMINNIY